MRFVEHLDTVSDIRFTNTRLMGVVGGYVRFSSGENVVYEIFHVDYEDYGIDRYEKLVNPEKKELTNLIKEVCGGLGGEFVDLSLGSLVNLLSEGYRLNISSGEESKIDEIYYKKINNIPKEDYIKKLSPELTNENQLLNYFLMRAYGRDAVGYNSLYHGDFFTDIRGTMLKNSIELSAGKYTCTSLVMVDTSYYLSVCDITLKKMKIVHVNCKESMKISDLEAALLMRRSEFLDIYTLYDDSVEYHFMNEHREWMLNLHYNGKLFTEFKKNNDHVKSSNYMLNEDVKAVYFITDEKQLLVMSFDQENLDTVADTLLTEFGDNINHEERIVFDEQVLYDFVGSDYIDFYEFMDEYF